MNLKGLRGAVEGYVAARQELDRLKLRIKELTNDNKTGEVDKLENIIIGFIEMNPVSSLESKAGYKLGKGTRRSSDITDWSELREWANVEGDDYIRERWGILQNSYKMKDVKQGVFIDQPNKRLLNIMLKYYAILAEQTGRDINDLLPPGLGQKTTTYIIMRKPTKKDKEEELQGVGDTLLDMAKRGVIENG